MIAHLFPLEEEKKCNCEKEKTGLQSFAERKNCEVFKAHAVKKKKAFSSVQCPLKIYEKTTPRSLFPVPILKKLNV